MMLGCAVFGVFSPDAPLSSLTFWFSAGWLDTHICPSISSFFASATMKLDNQINGWKGVCVYQQYNGDEQYSPVRAVGRRFVSICKTIADRKAYLSAYWTDGKQRDVTSENISAGLKFGATALYYPSLKGIPIGRVDT